MKNERKGVRGGVGIKEVLRSKTRVSEWWRRRGIHK